VSGFRATGACKAQGFSDEWIRAGQAVDTDLAKAIVPGIGYPLAAYDTAKKLAPILGKLSNPERLTAEDLKTLSEQILIPSSTAKLFLNDALIPFIIAGPSSSSPGNYPISGGHNK
jgi:hypothetical protein